MLVDVVREGGISVCWVGMAEGHSVVFEKNAIFRENFIDTNFIF